MISTAEARTPPTYRRLAHDASTVHSPVSSTIALLLALIVSCFGARPAAAGATNQIWFLNLIFPGWTCDADVASACYVNNQSWREYAFSYIYPARGVAGSLTGEKAFFVINEWSAPSGPGTKTWGDSPTLWMADNTYLGVRGRSNLRYLGDLSPDLGPHHHWGGYPLVYFAWQDWVVLLEETPDDHLSTLYYRRGNPFSFYGSPNDGKPGPPASAFNANNTVWKESQVCDTRLAGLTYVPAPGGQPILYGFVTWNGRKMVNGVCQYAWNGLFLQTDHVIINFATRQFKIKGQWYPFGSEFPINVSTSVPKANQYTGSWDIANTPWGYYAFRSVPAAGTGSPSNPPSGCSNPSLWAANLSLDSGHHGVDYLRAPLATIEYAKVDPINGTVLTAWTKVTTPFLPSKNRMGAAFAGVGSWSHGTYLYQATNELTACWQSPLIDWNLQSGSSYLVYDWTP